MTQAELKTVLDSSGIPFAYRAWKNGHDLPFGVFYFERDNPFAADGIVYAKKTLYALELYTAEKDPDTEAALENALTAAGMCAIAWLLVKIVRHPLGQWSLAIILGGGIGNLIDRVRLGYVVDMLDTMFMDFPVFNVADVFVVCGTVCALIYYLAFYSKSDEKNWGNKVDGTDPAANK